jgi:phosphatidylglycerol lysyltransferase
VAHCRQRGWTPCLYSVDDDVTRRLRTAGWSDVQVAEEIVLPLGELSFTGRRWQDVRTALNKARRTGTVARWTTYPAAPLTVREQIRAISEEWSADKGLPEMGFTLGGLAELDDPDVRLLLAVDADGTVQAVTSWLPVFVDGEVVGRTLDFMRRRTDSPGGLMEFLIATAALDIQAEGGRFLSLSGAPLARVDSAGPVEGVQRLLDILARRLEPVYGFGSLLAFKAKFQPVYQPLFLVYPDPVALPAIGTALARAYLPDLTPRELTRLARAVLH